MAFRLIDTATIRLAVVARDRADDNGVAGAIWREISAGIPFRWRLIRAAQNLSHDLHTIVVTPRGNVSDTDTVAIAARHDQPGGVSYRPQPRARYRCVDLPPCAGAAGHLVDHSSNFAGGCWECANLARFLRLDMPALLPPTPC